MAPRPLTIRRSIIVDVPLATMWELLSDTSRANHAMGLPALEWSERTRDDQRTEVIGSTRYGPLPLRWIEHPYEWIMPQQHFVEREFLDVPLVQSLVTGSTLRAVDSQRTEVVSQTTLHTGTRLAKVAALAIVLKLERAHVALIRRLEDAYTSKRGVYFPEERKVRLDWTALQARLERMNTSPSTGSAGLEHLLDLLQTGRDEDVSRMRPFVLADAWGLDRLAVLRMFLYATQAGLLDMHWDVLCPNCRVSREQFTQLSDLRETAHCNACQIEYNVNFDDYVELRFAANQAIRPTSDATFCALGGPSYHRHILAQQRIAAGEQRIVQLELPAGGYRLRVLGSEQRCLIASAPEGASSANVAIRTAGLDPERLELQAGSVTLTLHNQTSHEQLAILERDTWNIPFVSAALVTSLPEFRALFSSQVLAPGLGLAIRNLTIVFSDLKNSTPLYEQIGDSSAYALVRDHFDLLFQSIANHNGAVVKTIGDAVMAVFTTPRAGMQASLEMLHTLEEYNRVHPDAPNLILKLGMHTGPCIAVTANETLDYFGTTVNAAARAQAISEGGDVVATSDVWDDPQVQELLETVEGAVSSQFTRDLKGLQNAYTLHRLRLRPTAS